MFNNIVRSTIGKSDIIIQLTQYSHEKYLKSATSGGNIMMIILSDFVNVLYNYTWINKLYGKSLCERRSNFESVSLYQYMCFSCLRGVLYIHSHNNEGGDRSQHNAGCVANCVIIMIWFSLSTYDVIKCSWSNLSAAAMRILSIFAALPMLFFFAVAS